MKPIDVNSPEMLAVYHDWAAWALQQCGVDVGFSVVENRRLATTMGRATLGSLGGIIEYNPRLFARADALKRRNTIVHEACHLVARKLGGKGHGPEWRRAMRQCGETPTRCHNVDVSGLRREQATVTYRCGCTEYQLSMRRHRSGRVYRCRLCREILREAGR